MFRFKLQQVLNYREQLRDQAQIEFAKIQKAYDEAREACVALEKTIEGNKESLFKLDIQAHNERWLIEQCLKGLEADLQVRQVELTHLAQALDQAQKDLIERAKEHKVLEKLKERQKSNHAQEEKAKEQQDFDESSSMRYSPKDI